MHSGNEWLEPTGSQLEMDHGQRWIAAREGLRPQGDCGQRWITRWITVRYRLRADMDRDRIWMDDRRWMTGDGSREIHQGRRMTINLLSYMKLRNYNRPRICRHTVFQRHGSTEYDAKQYSEHYSEHYSEIPDHAPTCPSSNAEYDAESDLELQQQCRYRTSRTRLIFVGATIFTEGHVSAGFATTLNANNYSTGNTATKHRETHSPIETASNCEKCTKESDRKRTYR